MKAAEDALWGAASSTGEPKPSQVQVAVALVAAGRPDQPFEVVDHNQKFSRQLRPRIRPHLKSIAPPYAAFPLQSTEREAVIGMGPQTVQVGVRFMLTLIFPSAQCSEVEATLWAWETFGGLGARTRRGFGALHCTHIDGIEQPPIAASEIESWLHRGIETHVINGKWPKNVPHLSRDSLSFVVIPGGHSPIESWHNLIDALKSYRQQRNPGIESSRPGRSRWPEPDEIRALTGQSAPRHARRISHVHKFPRAVLGLPIITHFKDQREGDPADTWLQGAQHDQLASPLILRPLVCAKGQVAGLALVLDGPRTPPGGLILKQGNRKTWPVRAELSEAEANSITNNNGRPLLGGASNALIGFLKYLERR